MKPLLFLSPLIFAACAPRAILLLDAGATAPGPQSRQVAAADPAPPAVEPTPVRRTDGDGLGLLEPKDLARMPEEQEMRPTVNPDDDRPVIATPPANEE